LLKHDLQWPRFGGRRALTPTRETKNANLSNGSSEIGETMCSQMPTVQTATTTAPLRGACRDIRPPVPAEHEPEFIPLHMNWILVEDAKGSCQAHMRWVGER
jgi:hypothetical protein